MNINAQQSQSFIPTKVKLLLISFSLIVMNVPGRLAMLYGVYVDEGCRLVKRLISLHFYAPVLT